MSDPGRRLVAAILAAGRGRRMGPLGDRYPKALLPVGGRPVIHHQLELLDRLGVADVHVVVGHRAADVVAALGTTSPSGARLHYVEQGPPLGSAHGVGCLRPRIDRPFLLLLGDYLLETAAAERMVTRLADGSGAIAAKREADRELIRQACCLEVDRTGRVRGIVEKPVDPPTDLKGCGFYALPPSVFDAVARTPRTALRDEYELSVALELHLEAGHPLFAEEIVDRDANLTEPYDLLESNLAWLRHRARTELIASGAAVDPSAELHLAVVGQGAQVGSGAQLEQVVVLDGATVPDGEILQRAIVTPVGALRC